MKTAVDLEAGYENIWANCPKCGVRNTYNRATDIGHFDPIANTSVVCSANGCQAVFDVCGDLINPSHEMLLLDSYDFIREKRYMQAVLSATTAFEVIFGHFLRVELVYRPVQRDVTTVRDDVDWLNFAAQLLQSQTEFYPFEAMRRTFLRVAVDDVRPPTLSAAEATIQSLPDRPSKVPRPKIEGVSNITRRDLLLNVADSAIAKLRNSVVHKSAYRPTLDETRAAVDEAHTTIHGLGQHYRLASDNFHLNESADDR